MITRARIRAKDLLFSAVDRLGLAAAVNPFLPEGRIVPVRWLDDNQRGFVRTLDPAIPGRSLGPREGDRQAVAEVTLPAVNLYRFEEGTVSAVSSAVVFPDEVVLERVVGVDPRRCELSAGMVARHGARTALVVPKATERIEAGLFLGGNGAFNYYHWMIELLPKLQYLDRIGEDLPLLVSEDVAAIPTFAESLAAITDRPRITLAKDRAYQVGALWYVNAPNNSPFNIRRRHRMRAADYFVRPSAIAWLRERFVAREGSDLKRLFFARKNERRKYNDAEVWAIFEERGFEPVFMEDLTLSQQVAAMAGAAMIAGPSGAAWTNLIFCRPGTRALCWMSEDMGEFAAFSALAGVAGADLRYVTYPTHVNETSDLYFLPYQVDPRALRRALDQLLG